MPATTARQVEPKLFFANERTFIHWLNMAVTLSSLGAAVLAFSPEDALSEVSLTNGLSQYHHVQPEIGKHSICA